MDFTIIDYYGRQQSKCGYCKGVQCNIGYGMHAYTMAPQDYQDLIDRGWRRSGHYCYKQDNTQTCCPHYTIKCSALDFKLSKSHKKIIKRMNRFLRDGKRDKNEEEGAATATNGKNGSEDGDVGDKCDIREDVEAPDIPVKEINLEEFAKANADKKTDNIKTVVQNEKSQTKDIEKNIKEINEETPNNSSKSQDGLNPPCKKAKQMRLERRLAKQAAKGLPAVLEKPQPRNQEKTLQEFLNDTRPDDKHKLKIVLVRSTKRIYTDTAFALYRKYQLQIHNDNPERLEPKRLQRFCYNSPLKLEIIHVESQQFQDTLKESYQLYAKYQTRVHNDPPTVEQDYLDFLQSSPLELTKTADGPACGYGSFHQQYWLDDKLIAVAVIDILPYCVSAVYFFYDPDYSFLSLGTYSSLREIEFVQQLASKVPALKYYYMGFYIHSCPKMRYKGKLAASYLLCPEAYTWHLLTDEIRSLLDANKYQRFNTNPLAKDENEFDEEDMALILVLINQNTYVKYSHYKQIAGTDDDHSPIMEYGRLVGKPLAHRLLFLKM